MQAQLVKKLTQEDILIILDTCYQKVGFLLFLIQFA